MAQKSWNETGYEPLEGPVMCANNCGLFGSTTTMNLCPKCYRNLIADQERASSITLSADLGVESCSSSADKHPCVDLPCQISAINAQNSNRAANRCFSCRKRVGLLGFKCRCGNVFCSMHRYSEKHECSFDYKTAGREAIAKANPVVIASKVVRI